MDWVSVGSKWVCKMLRKRVIKVLHESIFDEHPEMKEIKNWIQTNFYWPGMLSDIANVC